MLRACSLIVVYVIFTFHAGLPLEALAPIGEMRTHLWFPVLVALERVSHSCFFHPFVHHVILV